MFTLYEVDSCLVMTDYTGLHRSVQVKLPLLSPNKYAPSKMKLREIDRCFTLPSYEENI